MSVLRAIVTSVFLIALGHMHVVALVAQSSPGAAKVAEVSLRRLATSKPMPVYPASSIARKVSGVAVAAVIVGVDGHMRMVEILQAPDAPTGAAVKAALTRWICTPVQVQGRTEQFETASTVTFYFQITAGKANVLNPDEMPGGPAWPRSPTRATSAGQPPPPSAPPPTARSGAAPPLTEISEADLPQLVATEHPLVLDVRDREEFARHHRDGAINIPFGELSVRGGIELPKTKYIVIDCTYNPQFFSNAGTMLTRLGFTRVALLMP